MLSALILVGTAFAVTIYYSLFYPQKVEIPIPTYELKAYLNGSLWEDGTSIDWGSMNVSSESFYYLNVTNTGSTNVNVMLTIAGLPEGMTEIWSVNNTSVIPGGWANGTLTLNVGLASPGNYTWASWVQATSPTP